MSNVVDIQTRAPVAQQRPHRLFRRGDRVRVQRSGNIGVVEAVTPERVRVRLMGGVVRSVRPADLAPAPTPPDGGAA